MILDACRDDPFPNSDRSLSRGLGRINTKGSIIAFATAIGDTTPDNSPNGRNGLFTYHYFQDPLKNGDLGPKMTWIPAGSVVMGNKTIGIGRFAMGIYEVTVAEYTFYINGFTIAS